MQALSIPQSFELSLHYGDFDPYQHVNATVYPNLVNTALWNLDPAFFSDRQMQSIQMSFLAAIPAGTRTVTVGLELEGYDPEKKQNRIRYTISKKEHVFSKGVVALVEPSAYQASSHCLRNDPALLSVTPWGIPLCYEWKLPVLHNDRDLFHKLDCARILEFVTSSRWYFVKEKFNKNMDDFVREGLGFFFVDAEIELKTPIEDLHYLLVRSWISEIQDEGKRVLLSFEIKNEDQWKVHAQGELGVAVVDITGERPKRRALPENALSYFFR